MYLSDPSNNDRLNLAAWTVAEEVLGPGKRLCLWVQGCCRNCPGCIAPGWQEQKANHMLLPEQLADDCFKEDFEGLTISGGEPFLQSAMLIRFIDAIRIRREINIICFTGYLYEELVSSEQINLISRLDVLIDGEFRHDQNTISGLRGSANQRILNLTDTLKDVDLETYPKKIVIQQLNNTFLLAGIPTMNIMENIQIIFDSMKVRCSSANTLFNVRQDKI